MAFTEDLALYFADFGVACDRAGVAFTAIYDAPSDLIGVGEVGTIGPGESILYRTAAVTLGYNETITVDGRTYRVNEVRAVDDGQLTRALIGRV